ncbi:MAG: 5'-methylthioadenosine/S-adenosylhomocysteine nucleosidase [Clostridia bacterium]
MRPIIIQGAMDIEIHLLISSLNATLDKTIGGFMFYKADYQGYPIIISKTNIGMSNSASATTIGILTYNPVAIINQGTAGAHSRDAHVGDIIIATSTANICSFEKSAMKTGTDYKLWKHTDFRDHDDNADKGASFKGDDDLVRILSTSSYSKTTVHKGVIGSGDTWNKEIEFIEFLIEKLDTMCEDMETASVYNVANRFGVPVIGVRVISNNEVTLESYDRHSADNCQNFMLGCLESLTNHYKNI